MTPSEEDVDEAADEIAEATEGQSEASKWFARGYLLSVVALVVLATVYAVQTEILAFDVTVTADLQVGWVIEYALIGVIAIVLGFTFLMLVKAVGGQLLASVIRAVSRIMDNYEREQ